MKGVVIALAAVVLLAGLAWPLWNAATSGPGPELEKPVHASQEFPPEPNAACLEVQVINEVTGEHTLVDHSGQALQVARHAWPAERNASIYGGQALLDWLRLNSGVLHRHILHEAHWHILNGHSGHADEGLGHKDPHRQPMTRDEVNRIEAEVVAEWPNLCVAIEATT